MKGEIAEIVGGLGVLSNGHLLAWEDTQSSRITLCDYANYE